MNKQEKYNNYASLITVFSLLLLVVYTDSEYDIWDIIISLIASLFGYCYVREKAYFDKGSKFLISLILSFGITIAIFSSGTLIFSLDTFFNDINLLIASVVLFSIVMFYIAIIRTQGVSSKDVPRNDIKILRKKFSSGETIMYRNKLISLSNGWRTAGIVGDEAFVKEDDFFDLSEIVEYNYTAKSNCMNIRK